MKSGVVFHRSGLNSVTCREIIRTAHPGSERNDKRPPHTKLCVRKEKQNMIFTGCDLGAATAVQKNTRIRGIAHASPWRFAPDSATS